MNSKATYWFDQPYMPGALNLAVCPKIDPRDGRLCFSVPDSGIWGLHGELIKDGDDYFEFKCNDELMHARGGTYKFTALDIKTFRKETYKWISQGEDIAKACYNTDDLYFWYRKNWPNTRLFEIDTYEMQENKRLRCRTDYWNKDNWEREAQREREKQEMIANRLNSDLRSGANVFCSCFGQFLPVGATAAKARYFVCERCGKKWDTKEKKYV